MHVIRLNDTSLLTAMQWTVEDWFSEPVATYTAMDAQTYRAIVASAQDQMNRLELARHIAYDIQPDLCDILKTKDVMLQSNLYLRAARPSVNGQDAVGWHRESFYGCPQKAINLWMPVLNVTPENSINYIPDSESIPDDQIQTVSEEDGSVQRKSAGHKIGLLYAPKRIVAGVDFSGAKPFEVNPGEAAIFPSSLIHGAAVNRTDKIRFSVDFRLIAKEHIGKQKHHFASGRDFFVPLEAA